MALGSVHTVCEFLDGPLEGDRHPVYDEMRTICVELPPVIIGHGVARRSACLYQRQGPDLFAVAEYLLGPPLAFVP